MAYTLKIVPSDPVDPYFDCKELWFRTSDDEVIAYALIGWTALDELTVLEIEVRPGYRNQGVGSAVLVEIAERFNEVVHTNGDFTYDGFTYLPEMEPNMLYTYRDSGHLPPVPGGVSIFVDDWDRGRP